MKLDYKYFIQHFFTLFDTVAHPIAVTELNGDIIFVNSEFEELTLHTNEVLKGMSINNLIPGKHKKKIEAALEVARRQGGDFRTYEHRIMVRKKNRKQIATDVNISKFKINKQSIVVYSFTDLTMIENMQREKERTNTEMTHLARLADIGRLAAGIAHELNNPLQIIMGLSENAKNIVEDEIKGEPREAINSQIDPMIKATHRMAEIIKNMMKMSRQEKTDMEELDLALVVESTLDLVRGSLKENYIHLETSILEDLLVTCSPNQVEQVILNVIVNAIHSLKSRKDDRTIMLEIIDTREAVCLEITNNGEMIPEEFQKSIMSPFFTTKPVGSGTGLGLFVSFGIMKAHGGDIKLANSDEESTTFVIRFPKKGYKIIEEEAPAKAA